MKYNKGTFLNYPIKDFIQSNNKKEEIFKEVFKKLNVKELSNNNIFNVSEQIIENKSIIIELNFITLH